MKAVLTVAIVLNILLTSAYADTPVEKLKEDFPTKQNEKNIELCTQNLVAIGKALQTYRKEHGGTSAVAFRSTGQILGG